MALPLTDPLKGTSLNEPFPLSLLSRVFPLEKVRAVLQATGRSSVRERDLPAHLVVYYVIGLAFFLPLCCREVLRCMWQELQAVRGRREPRRVATKSSITDARKRLGWEAVKRLYEELVQPIAVAATQGAWYRNWRLVTIDGSTLDVADSPENEQAFGRPKASRGRSAFPQIRWVSLLENGTHVLFGAVLDRYRTAETTLARELLRWLNPSMLCLADRNFYSFLLWTQAVATGAQLLWRIKKDLGLPCCERLPDGSYLSRIYPSGTKCRDPQQGVVVRVIPYQLRRGRTRYRLLTTLLDPQQAPALELAALYHERWEVETTIRELKTYLRGANRVLRSQRPELVRQEFYGMLLAHFAVRGFMHEAALGSGQDPDRLSFTHTVCVLRRRLPSWAAIPPSGPRGRPPRNPGGDPARTNPLATEPSLSTGCEAQSHEIPNSAAQTSPLPCCGD